MTPNETESPYWKIPEKGTTLEIIYKYDEKQGGVIRLTDSHEDDIRTVTQQSFEFYGERIENARKLVHEGKISPLYYHMERTTIELPVLASFVSLSKWRVKRHFKPSVYKRLKRPMLERYANAFDVKIEDLNKIY